MVLNTGLENNFNQDADFIVILWTLVADNLAGRMNACSMCCVKYLTRESQF
jgi:hypothetical protein